MDDGRSVARPSIPIPQSRRSPVYLVLSLGLGLTLGATLYVKRMVDIARERRFTAAVDDVRSAIEQRMDAYLSILRGTGGLFAMGEPVTRAGFHEYVESLAVQTHYPGIQGLGFARLLRPEELTAHEAEVHAEGFPDYQVWPPGKRPFYTAVVFIEPFDWRNQRAFGYDMYTEPIRREAMERARHTGRPAATGKVTLVQETDGERQAGFLIYLPVYSPTTAGVLGPLRGWVYAPFRVRDLFAGIFRASSRSTVDFEIFDGDGVDPDRLLYDDDDTRRSFAERPYGLRSIFPLELAGRRWTVVFATRPGFDAGDGRTPLYALGIGLLITALLVVITREELRARAAAEDAAQRSALLADAGAVLNSSLDTSVTLERVVRQCVRVLADWCLLEIRHEDGSIHLAAAAHRDPELERAIQEGWRRYPPDPQAVAGLARVLRTGESQLMPVLPDALLVQAAKSSEHLALLRRLEMRSFMRVPMVTRLGVVGALTFVSSKPGRYGPRDLELARELAQRSATALDNARLYQEAQDAIRQREEFLSIAAHELKTPLTSIQLHVQMLRRRLPEDARRPVELFERQTVRLVTLVNQLLDVTRAGQGRLELRREEMDLAALAREVAARAREDLAAAGCRLELSCAEPVVGEWDRLRLDQVLTNLLSNAMKYGKGRPIHLATSTNGRTARLEVRDEGIGIAPEDRARVFDRFERAVSSRHYGGLGLGLYISRQIVEALGGSIRVEGRPGEGATFIVELPLRPPAMERPPPAQADGEAADDAPETPESLEDRERP